MRFVSILLVAVLVLGRPAFTQAVVDPAYPVLDDFLGEVDFWGPELSPSGEYLAGVRQIEDDSYLITVALNDPSSQPSTTSLENSYLNWVEWIDDERLLISMTTYFNARNGDVIKHEDWDDLGRRVYPVAVTRVLSMNRDGSDIVFMFGDDRRMNRNYFLGRVVSFLPGDADHILMAARRGQDLDLFKLNVLDGSFERIALGTKNTYRWYVDRDGEPAFRFNINRRGTVVYIFARQDRENGKIKWQKIKTIRLKRNDAEQSATEFSLLSPGPTETTYYVAARPDGEDKTGIYLYDFELAEFIETIKVHDRVDIEYGLFNRETREFQGVHYFDDRLVSEFEDADIQAHIDGLNDYFGHKTNVIPIMSNRDGTIWLIKTVGPLDAGSYHTYDLDETYIRKISSQWGELSGKRFGDVEIIEYEARDGLALTGYLTRPPDLESGVVPPLIMMPHGGPEIRDVVTFNNTVQVLVAHGYQVFQPNFRGSSGFGKAFADLGRREWGKAMQTDVEDGFAHLVEAGLVQSDRACIMGASYGGYVALVAATMTPDIYQCAISVAGPSDLVAMLKWERKEGGRDSETYKYWRGHIGNPGSDKAALNAVSPAKHAAGAARPILLIHGKDDGIVPIKQAELMERALRRESKDYTMITLEDSRHSYRSDEDERKEYEAILEFLKMHLPVDTGD